MLCGLQGICFMGRSGKGPRAHYIVDTLRVHVVRCALCAVLGHPPPRPMRTRAHLVGGQRCVKREEGRITGHAGPTAKPCCLGGRVRDMCLSGDLEDEWELAEVGEAGTCL